MSLHSVLNVTFMILLSQRCRYEYRHFVSIVLWKIVSAVQACACMFIFSLRHCGGRVYDRLRGDVEAEVSAEQAPLTAAAAAQAMAADAALRRRREQEAEQHSNALSEVRTPLNWLNKAYLSYEFSTLTVQYTPGVGVCRLK